MTSAAPVRSLGLFGLLVVVLLLAGCGSPVDSDPPLSASETSPASARPTDRPVPGSSPRATRTPRALRPTRIAVPAIGIDAEMTELAIAEDGSIEVPTDARQAGWLDTTPLPGMQGPSVIAGHVDSQTGPAVFYRLRELVPGDAIVVTRGDGETATFTVDGVRTYAQDEFPTDQVYGPVPGSALRLITCGGDYVKSAGGYQSNVVVYAS